MMIALTNVENGMSIARSIVLLVVQFSAIHRIFGWLSTLTSEDDS